MMPDPDGVVNIAATDGSGPAQDLDELRDRIDEHLREGDLRGALTLADQAPSVRGGSGAVRDLLRAQALLARNDPQDDEAAGRLLRGCRRGLSARSRRAPAGPAREDAAALLAEHGILTAVVLARRVRHGVAGATGTPVYAWISRALRDAAHDPSYLPFACWAAARVVAEELGDEFFGAMPAGEYVVRGIAAIQPGACREPLATAVSFALWYARRLAAAGHGTAALLIDGYLVALMGGGAGLDPATAGLLLENRRSIEDRMRTAAGLPHNGFELPLEHAAGVLEGLRVLGRAVGAAAA